VSSIVDTLPAGFTYVPGSTTGATTTDPAIAGQVLTWTGSFNVLGSGSLSFHFSVIVADTPGVYFNEVGGAAEASYNVISTGPTAEITVTAASPTPTPEESPTPTATATATATFTPTATATATFTPTATATATFTPTATATATSTPTPTPTPTPTSTPPGSRIAPTETTCTQFRDGTAATLANLNYTLRNGYIMQNVNPGVFFYWVRVTVPAGNNSFTITQTITTGNFTDTFDFTTGSNVFDSNCVSLHPTITQNGTTGAVTVQFNAPTAGTYIIGIKYAPKSVVGDPAPSPGTTVHYDFATTGVPGSTSPLDLIKQ